MKRMYVTVYHYRPGLEEDDLKDLTKRFMEVGSSDTVVAHYERLDGQGGFLIQEESGDLEKEYETTLRYNPWIEFENYAVTTIEEAFPVIQRVFG